MDAIEHIETNEHGLLARFSIRPAGPGASREPYELGYDIRPVTPLCLGGANHNDVDALLEQLWARDSTFRTHIEAIVESDQWTMICPFRVGYQTDENTGDKLTLVFTVDPDSMATERAVEVVIEAHNVLTR